MSVRSDLTTLCDLVKTQTFFTVPLYQRLYVWGDEQVKTLLADLLGAYQKDKEIFYLGGTLVVEREESDGGRILELIDGQQRFTTLWMLSHMWQEGLGPFQYAQEEHTRRPRLTFPIRPEVDRFFAQWMGGPAASLEGNQPILEALAIIKSFPNEAQAQSKEQNIAFDLADFTRFIFEKVQMVLTKVPAHTDLNKLFEVTNNRGMQLQHHEILKARMLGVLEDTVDRACYADLWDASSHMGNYVEKNLREGGAINIATLYNNDPGPEGREALACAGNVLAALKYKKAAWLEDTELKLETILGSPEGRRPSQETSADEEEYESDDVRSIITFPMLLQHTLRIWLHKHGKPDLPRILDKELLGLFEEHFLRDGLNCGAVTSFIKLLWEIRYCFDKYIIKWVTIGEEEQHLICKLVRHATTSRGKTSYSLVRQQPTSNEGFALLQSMLYYSQQITTHYWLTPLLAYMHANPRDADQDYYTYLRHLDNNLLSSDETGTLAERSRGFLEKPGRLSELKDIGAFLAQPLGVSFPHYWFYKLEFILWYAKGDRITDVQRSTFRMTAKNSVEHISPRTAQAADTNTVSADVLNTFGNLALVSRGMNSEFGNLPFNEKRQRFPNRNTARVDSLKMALIYHNKGWNNDIAREHQRQMIEFVTAYLTQPLLVREGE